MQYCINLFSRFFFQCQCNLDLNQHQPTLEKSEDEQSFEIEPSTMDSCFVTKFHNSKFQQDPPPSDIENSVRTHDYDCKEYIEKFSNENMKKNHPSTTKAGAIPIMPPAPQSLTPPPIIPYTLIVPPPPINVAPPIMSHPPMPHPPIPLINVAPPIMPPPIKMPHPPVMPPIIESLANMILVI